jgi:ribose/xylose/arabinose/galactoside ABC-type transport system permease subunit
MRNTATTLGRGSWGADGSEPPQLLPGDVDLQRGDPVAWLKRGRRYVGVGGALVGLVIIFTSLHPFFLHGQNITNILTSNSDLMLVAVGMTFAMVGGGFDLSVGSVLAGTAVLLEGLLAVGVPQLLAMVIAVLCAGLFGALVNGFLIGYARLNFLVVTLGTMSAVQGIVYVATNGNTLTLSKWTMVTAIGHVSALGLGVPIWFMIGAVVVAGACLRFTRLGRAIYAVGGNREAARIAGIRVGLITMLTYGVSAMFAGMAGLLDAGRLAAAAPTTGASINLIAGAAVLLGGTSFSGGEGGVFGTILGVLLIGALQNGLGVVGVSDFWQGVVTGAVLIAAVGLDQFQKARTRKRFTMESTADQGAGGASELLGAPAAAHGARAAVADAPAAEWGSAG